MSHIVRIQHGLGVDSQGQKISIFTSHCGCGWKGAPRARMVDATDDSIEHRMFTERMEFDDEHIHHGDGADVGRDS